MCIVQIYEINQGQTWQIQRKRRATTSDKTCWDTLQNTYFLHLPWQKYLQSQIKRPFPPSAIAMLFTVTEEMLTWAVKPKQHCTRGGEGRRGGGGGEFVPFGYDGCMARNWKLHWNASTLLSRVVDFFCGGSEKSRFQWLHKEQFQLYLRGRIYCFFNKFLILLGNRSRSESMWGFNWNNNSGIRFFEPLEHSNQQSFRSPPSDTNYPRFLEISHFLNQF